MTMLARRVAGVLTTVIMLSCGPGGNPASSRLEARPPTDGMVFVPPGMVAMGTDSTDIPALMQQFGLSRPDPLLMEVPPRTVDVAGFYLDSVEVTNRSFAEFVTARPEWSPEQIPNRYHNGRYLAHWVNGRPAPEVLDHPVTFVTWWAGVAFCA